ncbi:hypothetical protein [Roseibium sediminis]|uniref:hypothetical protein n=1 Tax=Roseibium sediminis TaxID=1775174 RepID=UPI00123E21BB|nr:hypothetical protein [Roseibium sediminis]
MTHSNLDIDVSTTPLATPSAFESSEDVLVGRAASSGEESAGQSPSDRSSFSAGISGSGLFSFSQNLDAPAVQDVLQSLRFAERAADAQFDRNERIEDWYQFYIRVLRQLGWTTSAENWDTKTFDRDNMTIGEEAFKLLSAVASANQLGIIRQALDTMAGLAKDRKEIKLFDFTTSVELGGTFQIGTVETAATGVSKMSLGAFFYRSDDRKRNFLFVTWGRNNLSLSTCIHQMLLNHESYAEYRDLIKTRLGDSMKDNLMAIPLA